MTNHHSLPTKRQRRRSKISKTVGIVTSTVCATGTQSENVAERHTRADAQDDRPGRRHQLSWPTEVLVADRGGPIAPSSSQSPGQVLDRAPAGTKRVLPLDFAFAGALGVLLDALPSLIAILLLESMPLRDPYSQWQSDWALWTRLWLTVFFVAFCIATIAMRTIPQLPLTRKKCLAVTIGTATGYVGVLCVVAIKLVYPIPFAFVLGAVTTWVICMFMLMLVMGRKSFQKEAGLWPQLVCFFRFFAAQSGLVVIYPAYNAIPVSVKTNLQNVLVVVLPMIKLVVKNGVSRSAVHLEDYLPAAVVFLVEVFNTLHLTACMQNAGSMVTALLIILMDFTQGVWALRGVYKRAKVLQELIAMYTNRIAMSDNDNLGQLDFLRIVLDIAEHPMRLEVDKLSCIRLRDCLKHSVSQECVIILAQLEQLDVYGDSSSNHYGAFKRPRQVDSQRRQSLISRRSNNMVVQPTRPTRYRSPFSMDRCHPSDSKQARLSNAAANHKTRLLFQTLQMLFR